MSNIDINVFHDEGTVFLKLEDPDTGISYVSVPVEEVSNYPSKVLLVRHGDPASNRCGYYPLNLLLKSSTDRIRSAKRYNKRPPSESWVRSTIEKLREAGFLPKEMHHA